MKRPARERMRVYTRVRNVLPHCTVYWNRIVVSELQLLDQRRLEKNSKNISRTDAVKYERNAFISRYESLPPVVTIVTNDARPKKYYRNRPGFVRLISPIAKRCPTGACPCGT